MNQGDIVLVRFPYSNLADYKIRPALIVSNNSFNKKFDAWFCPITSQESECCISLKNSLVEGGLEKESFAKTNVIATVTNEKVLKRIAKASLEKTNQIIREMIKNLE